MNEPLRWRVTIVETRETVYYLARATPEEAVFEAGEQHAAERVVGAKRSIRLEPMTQKEWKERDCD